MRIGEVTHSCDLCSYEVSTPAEAVRLPYGWQRVTLPGNVDRDVCRQCAASLRAWWYEQIALLAQASTP